MTKAGDENVDTVHWTETSKTMTKTRNTGKEDKDGNKNKAKDHDHYLDLTLQIKRCCFHFLDRGKLLCRPRCKALLCSQPATKTNNFQPNSQLASAHKYKNKNKKSTQQKRILNLMDDKYKYKVKYKKKKSTQPTKIFNPIDDKYSHILSVFQMFLKTV